MNRRMHGQTDEQTNDVRTLSLPAILASEKQKFVEQPVWRLLVCGLIRWTDTAQTFGAL